MVFGTNTDVGVNVEGGVTAGNDLSPNESGGFGH